MAIDLVARGMAAAGSANLDKTYEPIGAEQRAVATAKEEIKKIQIEDLKQTAYIIIDCGTSTINV